MNRPAPIQAYYVFWRKASDLTNLSDQSPMTGLDELQQGDPALLALIEHSTEEQMQAIFNHAAIGIAFTDVKGHFLRVNPTFCSITGYSEEELLKKDFHGITHTEDLEENLQLLEKMAAGTIPAFILVKRYIRKDGEIVWVRLSVSPLRDARGMIKHMVALTEDITEQKRIEEARFRLAAIVESSDDAIVSKTLDSIITSWNDAAERLFGYTAEEAIGQHITLIIPLELRQEEDEIISKLRKGIRIEHFETVRQRKDGSRVEVSLSISPVKDSTGRIIGASKIARDITERKELEHRKDDFIRMASHELKTPVTSLKGFTQLLRRRLQQRDDKETLHFLARMDGQLNKLTRLISELLDISRLQTGKLEYREELFELKSLVHEIMENAQGITSTHHLILEELAPVPVFGDKDRIGQVLMNLLTNAIKFSPKANEIIVRVVADGDNAIVSVQDFGIGIDERYQEKIFERFYQVDEPIVKTYPGLGIGLYIASEIIKRHQGRLWLESKKGEGSTFYFSLPARQSIG